MKSNTKAKIQDAIYVLISFTFVASVIVAVVLQIDVNIINRL